MTALRALSVLAALLFFALLIYATVRVVTTHGPCTPEQPVPVERRPSR